MFLILWDRANPHHGRGDWDTGLFHKFAKLFACTADNDTATRVDHWTTSQFDGRSHLANRFRGDWRRGWIVAGQVHLGIHLDLASAELDVLGHVDQNGAGAAAGGDMKCLFHNPRQVSQVGDQVVMLGDSATDFHHRRFLKRVRSDRTRWNLSGDAE